MRDGVLDRLKMNYGAHDRWNEGTSHTRRQIGSQSYSTEETAIMCQASATQIILSLTFGLSRGFVDNNKTKEYFQPYPQRMLSSLCINPFNDGNILQSLLAEADIFAHFPRDRIYVSPSLFYESHDRRLQKTSSGPQTRKQQGQYSLWRW